MDSKIGTIIQISGIFLITLLTVFLTNSHKSVALKYWRAGWISLSAALFCLNIAFNFAPLAAPFFIFYYVGEYAFAFLLIAGCRNYASGKIVGAKSCYLLIPAFSVACFLAFPFGDFNAVFNLHSFIMGAAFSAAFFALGDRENDDGRKSFGRRVMRVALALLALDFFHYTVVFTLLQLSVIVLPEPSYLAFDPIIDLVLEILLGFGTVIVLMERVQENVEKINDKLQKANEKLEQLAHVDPLTTAFTRHAFYGFLQKHGDESGTVSGSVGVFDIDNLKPINDGCGHAVGDLAIGAVAHAIRSLVRADDLLFRWGGDEFFVVMLGFDERQAGERMSRLGALLENVKLYGTTDALTIGVSYGFAEFKTIAELERAVERADAQMYKTKQARKQRAQTARRTNEAVERFFPVAV